MKNRIIQTSIALAAKKHNVTEERVIREIENCILQTWNAIQAENNQELMDQWRKIPSESEIPTAEELIAYVARRVQQEMES